MAIHQIELKEKEVLRERYEVVKFINSGGMSKVYLARDIKDPRVMWAVKVTHLDHKLAKSLLKEARLLSELDHPAIPKIADFFTSDDGRYFFLVQEYLDGQTLMEISETRQIGFQELLHYVIQLCDVLSYLHTYDPNPIIFKDMKPGNVMVVQEGKVKLIDFGVARKFKEEKLHDTVQVGTVGFAAPEQFEKSQTDQRSDIFSLGAMLYYLLSGGKYVYISQKKLTHYRSDLPKKLAYMVDKMVQLDPKERLQTIHKVSEAALEIFEEYEQAELRDHNPKNKRVSINWKYSIVIVLAGVLLGLFYIQSN